MKTKNLLFAGAIALSTVMSPMAAMISATPVFAEEVKIDPTTWGTNHTFKAYQIFSGTQGTNGILGNIVWGSDVNGDGIISDINSSEDANLIALKNAKSASDLASKLSEFGDDTPTAKAFAKVVENNLKENSGTSISTSSTPLTAGYYLIVDTTTNMNGVDDVVGLSILQLTGTSNGIVIKPKNGNPTPDKTVADEKTEGSQTEYVFGETADHDINEVFQFKLEAKSFTTTDIANYDSYYLKFVDNYSEGVTYMGGLHVTIKVGNNQAVEIPAKTETSSGYTFEETPSGTVKTGLTVEIENIKEFIPEGQNGSIVVEVTYNAKLNEKAILNDKTQTDIQNRNTLKLEYSNNPNSYGHGESEEDHVFVASFKLTNTKTDSEGNKLSGAGFKLVKVSDTKKYVATFDTAGKVTGWVEYEDDEDLKNKGTEIISKDSTGDFSMYGLDAGTYTLVETTTPDGYNTAANTPIIIVADHAENSNGDSATVTISQSTELNHTVVNTQNGTLPETGGMGTTMIYTAGAILVAGAAITFVTNKRMKRED